MTMVAGGLRSRLIRDSFYNMIHDALEDLGWFDAGRQHAPITMVPRALGLDEEVPLNTIAIADSSVSDDPAELGSLMSDDRWIYYVDFYAEDDPLGLHVIHDVRDVLRGKLPSIDRSRPVLEVYDWREATPPLLFTCDIEEVMTDRAQNFPNLWQKHWHVCRCVVVDTYASADDVGS